MDESELAQNRQRKRWKFIDIKHPPSSFFFLLLGGTYQNQHGNTFRWIRLICVCVCEWKNGRISNQFMDLMAWAINDLIVQLVWFHCSI